LVVRKSLAAAFPPGIQPAFGPRIGRPFIGGVFFEWTLARQFIKSADPLWSL
jgi:hypothetical protein